MQQQAISWMADPGITWFMDSAQTAENTTFWKWDLFLSSGERRETPTLLGPLERANLNHRAGVSLPSPEDGN
jgi:hypothetical protein